MEYGITFGEKTTWGDWGLIMTSQPVVNPPKPKTKILNPKGWDGEIDLSQAVTGYPVYENRVGSFSFAATGNWYATYGKILTYLHGRTMQAVLRNDPGWFYEGRFTVNSIKSVPQTATIVIDYSLGPYKWAAKTTTDGDWLWDPFCFVDGVIYSSIFTGIELTYSGTMLTFDFKSAGGAPVRPEFTATEDGAALRVAGGGESEIIVLDSGEAIIVDGLVLYGDDWLLDGKTATVRAYKTYGNPALNVAFRPGRL